MQTGLPSRRLVAQRASAKTDRPQRLSWATCRRLRPRVIASAQQRHCRFTPEKDGDHLSRTTIARRLERPTRESIAAKTIRSAGSTPAECSLFDLAPDGVCRARPVARPAGRLLPYRFTLTAPQDKPATRRFTFCCTFPSLSAGGRYPPSCLAVPGLSSRRRPSNEDARPPADAGNQRPPVPPSPGSNSILDVHRTKEPCRTWVYFRFCAPAAAYKTAEFRAKHVVSGLALLFASGCGCFFRKKGMNPDYSRLGEQMSLLERLRC